MPHLATGFEHLVGTVLDGEIVCPKAAIETGDRVTTHPLQATVAILATAPENAADIQREQDCKLRFVAFDLLRPNGSNATALPLRERLFLLESAFPTADGPHLDVVETHARKKGLEVEAEVTVSKPGTAGKGNADSISAVEFSIRDGDTLTPIARVSNWTDQERQPMTVRENGTTTLSPDAVGRKAVIGGHDIAARSGRIRHANHVRWIDAA